MAGSGELASMIEREAVARSDEPFTLSSGARSSLYFDLRRLAGDPRGLHLMARELLGMAAGARCASVGGLESGSIPLAAAASHLSHVSGVGGMSSFYVRKEAKAHGARRRVEGRPRPPAAIVDDVITSGASALSALDAVRAEGCECALVACIVYRGGEARRREIESRCPLAYAFDEASFAAPRAAG